ncbi:hypothetical protein DL766_007880 [Monosporascus sp. MC13-8B]|uniref:WW domain-containing protein n=1 Tax=Monosporascus cannonballus TaxID=155416 RepID=A0ABY0HD84_9PEZI|nr:hypothetical protein DL762_002735 [Monosporascus cannonballus]RYP21708.1 hypothetical protein DL766_007880 [Monosporascus sp. MC13-8B]
MLKSTYKPSPNALPPLPPGWTEHKAPTGHTYYYNSNTKESTYKRPGVDTSPAPQAQPQPAQPFLPVTVPAAPNPHLSHFQYASVPNLSDPAAANAFLAQYDPARQRQQQQQQAHQHGRGGYRGGGGDGREGRPRPQPVDKPRSKVPIPGCEPWILVYTKYGRRFVYNPVKNASYWRIPEKVMKGVLELDIKGIREKAKSAEPQPEGDGQGMSGAEAGREQQQQKRRQREEEVESEFGSEYEEVEVTDDEDGEEGAGGGEGGEDEEGGHRSKRQRTEEPGARDESAHMPVEFNEDDIAYQLQAMGEDYGLDPGEYDDGNADAWPEGAEGVVLSDADARELFKDLLNDHGVNPYSPWEKLLEDGRVFDDPRYTALATTKARREVWEEWSRERIRALREQRAREEQRDPRIPFLAFLRDKAPAANGPPKLYWPEFRRKHKKEPAMRDAALSDREREKFYRDHAARLRLPPEARKKDLAALLREAPLKLLNNRTHPQNLPPQVLADVRFIGLDPATRDELVEAYIKTLPPPPEDGAAGAEEEDEKTRKEREDRRKRERALEERQRVVEEQRRRQRRLMEQGKAVLREEERELEQAMRVDKKGLQSQLAAAAAAEGEREKERERERGGGEGVGKGREVEMEE